MRIRSLSSAAILVGVSLFATAARADVGPAPTCPTGLTSAYHYGRYCAPVSCSSSSDCNQPATCEVRGYCLAVRDPQTPNLRTWQGNCDGNQACRSGSTCVRESFCGERTGGAAPTPAAPPTPTPTPAPADEPAPAQPTPAAEQPTPSAPAPAPSDTPGHRRGCAVSTAGTQSGSAFGVFASASLLAVALRRRRR